MSMFATAQKMVVAIRRPRALHERRTSSGSVRFTATRGARATFLIF